MKTNNFQSFLTKYVNNFVVIVLPVLLFSDDRLRLIHADILENKPIEGGSVQELKGDVLFKKGEMELSCKKPYLMKPPELLL